jgi:hypothetical protein
MVVSAASIKVPIKGGSFLIETRAPRDVFTSEDITDQHKLIGRTAQEFIDQEIVPRLHEIEDKKPGVLRELLTKAAGVSLCATDVPSRFGGLELDKISSIIVSEKMARNGSWAATVGAHGASGFCPLPSLGPTPKRRNTSPNWSAPNGWARIP